MTSLEEAAQLPGVPGAAVPLSGDVPTLFICLDREKEDGNRVEECGGEESKGLEWRRQTSTMPLLCHLKQRELNLNPLNLIPNIRTRTEPKAKNVLN